VQQFADSAPIGLQLTRVARVVGRAFDDALAEAGGSLPMWLVLLNLKIHPRANQRELADAVGVREPTLTQHLNAMEKDGLLTRRRDASNRRIHIVEVTDAGNALFLALRNAAIAFDATLRHDVPAPDLEALSQLLDRLAANVGGTGNGAAWRGLADTRPTRVQLDRPDPDQPPQPAQREQL
jgi:MarR family transcriptional regulator for hemolysin